MGSSSPNHRRPAIIPLLLLLLSCFALEPAGADGGCYMEAVYSFGDSIADTGNFIRGGTLLGPLATVLMPPYGDSALDGEPSGRFSDGLLMIDYFAQSLGLPLVPPHLDESANFVHGVNFAVAGATALDTSFFPANGMMMPYTNSSLEVQLNWFKAHLHSTCASTDECRRRFRRAIFFVGEIGGNDYNYAVLSGKPFAAVKAFVPMVIGRIISAVKEVISAGAVNLVVPGNFPFGCAPIFLTLFGNSNSTFGGYDEYGCIKDLNSLSAYHNDLLRAALGELRKENPGVSVLYADYYSSFIGLITGEHYGFDRSAALKACCGVGGNYNFDLNRPCGAPGVAACQFPSKSISWDGTHLTQRAYQIMASEITTGGLADAEPEHRRLWSEWLCR